MLDALAAAGLAVVPVSGDRPDDDLRLLREARQHLYESHLEAHGRGPSAHYSKALQWSEAIGRVLRRLQTWEDACEAEGLPRDSSPETFAQHHYGNATVTAQLNTMRRAIDEGQLFEGRYVVLPADDERLRVSGDRQLLDAIGDPAELRAHELDMSDGLENTPQVTHEIVRDILLRIAAAAEAAVSADPTPTDEGPDVHHDRILPVDSPAADTPNPADVIARTLMCELEATEGADPDAAELHDADRVLAALAAAGLRVVPDTPSDDDELADRLQTAALGELPERCPATLGERPSWMSPGQYDPCHCRLPNGHDGDHECSHGTEPNRSPGKPERLLPRSPSKADLLAAVERLRVSGNPQLLDEVERLRSWLQTVMASAGGKFNGCECFTGAATCRTDPSRSPDAEYGAERWCQSCMAAAALEGRPAPRAAAERLRRVPDTDTRAQLDAALEFLIVYADDKDPDLRTGVHLLYAALNPEAPDAAAGVREATPDPEDGA